MNAAEQLQPVTKITRFRDLFDPEAHAESVTRSALFDEFSTRSRFLNKKHPGWSPANFDPPTRALENVQSVSMLVLDYDNKGANGLRVGDPISVDEMAEALAGYLCQIHTTRSHTKDWPRFRVILPMTRAVSRTEYRVLWQAAAERWPGSDPKAKDASRFWYTPGMGDHEGAEFDARKLDGELLDPDKLISEARTEPKPPTPLPLPRPKTIGAGDAVDRARAYVAAMPPAISGSDGHTATFNVACKLVWGFELDHEQTMTLLREYNGRCQPLWNEQELQHKATSAREQGRNQNPIEDRRIVTVARSVEATARAFDGELVPKVDPEEWRKHLRCNQNNQVTKDVGNAILLLKNEPGFRGCLGFDTMAHCITWTKQPGYDVGIENHPKQGSELADHHAAYVQAVLAKDFGLSIGKEIAWQAIDAVAHDNEFHPVQEYLDGLAWDGRPRLRNWLHRYLGADDSDYHAAVGRWWLISAVARALRPGCQADHALILEGKQGEGKSQAIRVLGGPKWTLGSLPDLRDMPRAADTISGSWIVEIAELDAFKGVGMTRVKDFVSQQVDKYRPAYARATVRRARSCVFIGTTNETNYLTDPTGARRFWPVKVRKVDLERLAEDRDQLWAEARNALDAGEPWHPDLSLLQGIEAEQEARRAVDPWEDLIRQFCTGLEYTTTNLVMTNCLNIEPSKQDRSIENRVGGCLTKIGWERKRIRAPWANREKVWTWFPPTGPTGPTGPTSA